MLARFHAFICATNQYRVHSMIYGLHTQTGNQSLTVTLDHIDLMIRIGGLVTGLGRRSCTVGASVYLGKFEDVNGIETFGGWAVDT